MGLFNLPTPNRYRATKACMEWHDYNKRKHPFRGLSFFKVRRGSVMLAARHWQTSITWSWVVDFHWRNVGYWWNPRAWWWINKHNSGGQGRITPWLHFAWQHEMPHFPKNYRAEKAFIEDLRKLGEVEQ